MILIAVASWVRHVEVTSDLQQDEVTLCGKYSCGERGAVLCHERPRVAHDYGHFWHAATIAPALRHDWTAGQVPEAM